MAASLTAIGLLLVRARTFLDRRPRLAALPAWTAAIGCVTAGAVVLGGTAITARGLLAL
jgi:hypothetical protein